MKNYVNNGKNFNKKPIDLSIKNEQIAFCSNLPCGILSFSSYVDIKTMDTISSDKETNEYKLLENNLKQIVNALKQNKLKYMGFNIPKLKYMIKEFKDELKKLKSILNGIEKFKMVRQLEMEQAYEISKEIE